MLGSLSSPECCRLQSLSALLLLLLLQVQVLLQEGLQVVRQQQVHMRDPSGIPLLVLQQQQQQQLLLLSSRKHLLRSTLLKVLLQ